MTRVYWPLRIRTTFFHEEDRELATEIGLGLYDRFTRPRNDPLAAGPGVPVDVACEPSNTQRGWDQAIATLPVLRRALAPDFRGDLTRGLEDLKGACGASAVLGVHLGADAAVLAITQRLYLESLIGTVADAAFLDTLALRLIKRSRPPQTPIELHVAHTPQATDDAGQAAQAIIARARQSDDLGSFFDTVTATSELAPTPAEQAAAPRATRIFLAICGDDFSRSARCRLELLQAKQLDHPTLAVLAQTRGERRSSPYAGNIPTVVWKGNAESVLLRAAMEWIRASQFAAHAKRNIRAAGLPESTRVLFRPPELSDVVGGSLGGVGGKLVLHPDPELLPVDRELVQRANPRLRLATPATAHRHALSPLDASIQSPLDGLEVGLSLSGTALPEGRGIIDEHLQDAVIQVARSLVSSGARLAYGGDARQGGYTRWLGEIVAGHNRSASGAGQELQHYVAANGQAVEPEQGVAVRPRLIHEEFAGETRVPQSNNGASPHPSLYVSDMRRIMSERIAARIVIGGKLHPKGSDDDALRGTGYGGLLPGVAEEAWWALQQGIPLYTLGGFGGASEAVTRLLCGEETPEELTLERWAHNRDFQQVNEAVRAGAQAAALHLPLGLEDLAQQVRSAGERLLVNDTAALAWNGLTRDENKRLFTTRDPVEIAALVSQGLLKHQRSRVRGELSIELVRGCPGGSEELDAVLMGAFDTALLSGTDAALDEALDGQASRNWGNQEVFLPIHSKAVASSWLYVADLGSLEGVRDPEGPIRSAARRAVDAVLSLGIRRVGVVTFGGTAVSAVAVAAQAMLSELKRLRGHSNVLWFELGAARFDALRKTLRRDHEVRLTTRKGVPPAVVPESRSGTLTLSVELRPGSLEVLVVPPRSATALSHSASLSAAELQELVRGEGAQNRHTPGLDELERRRLILTKRLFGNGTSNAVAQNDSTDIRVIHNAAAARLPFELLLEEALTSESAPGDQTANVHRWLRVDSASPTRGGTEPTSSRPKVLIIVNPRGDLPGAAEEGMTVAQALDGRVTIERLSEGEATRARVLEALEGAHALHYCGHAFCHGGGDDGSGLQLADGDLTLADLRGSDLPLRFAFLNACESAEIRGTAGVGVFAELLRGECLEAYLGTRWRVSDSAAKVMAQRVYTALLAGRSLSRAVFEGRRELRRCQNKDWANYLLYGDGRMCLPH